MSPVMVKFQNSGLSFAGRAYEQGKTLGVNHYYFDIIGLKIMEYLLILPEHTICIYSGPRLM